MLRLPLATGTLEDLKALSAAKQLRLLCADIEDDQPSAHPMAPAPSSSSPPSPSSPALGGNGDRSHATAAAASASLDSAGVALVLGSEGKGLSAAVRAACTPVAVPMPGEMESLNVGVAGGILMFMLGPAAGVQALQARLARLLGSSTTAEPA